MLLFKLEGSIQWLIGDWIVYGEDWRYGDVKRIAEALDRDAHTLYNYVAVCRGIESSRRRELVSFSHHYEVMGFSADQQSYALSYAETTRIPLKAFRKWIKQGMPADGPKEELSATNERSYNISKLAKSVEYILMGDLSNVSRGNAQERLGQIEQLLRFAEEARSKLIDILEKGE